MNERMGTGSGSVTAGTNTDRTVDAGTARGRRVGSRVIPARTGREGRTMSGVTPAVVPDPRVRRLRAVLAAAAGWYRQRLLVDRASAVVGLLQDRGLVDLAVDTPAGRRWQAGYAPPRHTAPSGYGNRTAAGERGDGLVAHLGRSGFTAAEMVDAGLVVPGRGGDLVEVLRDRLVIPLVDGGGVVGFTARRLTDPATATTGTTDSPGTGAPGHRGGRRRSG